MPFNAIAGESVQLDGVQALSATHSVSPTEKLQVDVELAAGLVDEPITIGIEDTAKLKYLMIKNAGTADLTALKADAGVVNLALKAGEVIVAAGPGIAKKLADAWSGATTLDELLATTPAGPALVRLQVVALFDN